ncbi:MAG: hypothetical protein DRI95_00535 [Bacteroidetes bacterium]|nr:MAG: hypothetical protein DRI95_00535 [Bacteroidota bacterium]
MKNINPKIAFIFLMLMSLNVVLGQSAKKYYKAGKTFQKTGNYEDAGSEYTKAINLDPTFTKAYIGRATIYEKLGEIEGAVADYKKLTSLLPKKHDYFYHAGRLYYDLEKYDESLIMLNGATNISKKAHQAYEYKVKALLAKEDYKAALPECTIAIDLNPVAENFYNLGIINGKLNNYALAESNFIESVTENPNYIESYIELGYVCIKLEKLNDALNAANKALNIDSKNKKAYVLRSIVYKKKLDYPSAINDLSKVTLLYPEDKTAFFLRGLAYHEFNQFQNAINDFSKVIGFNPKNFDAIYKRANAYEQIGNFEKAIKDYEKLGKLNQNDPKSKKLLSEAKTRLFELNREGTPPVIIVKNPIPKNLKNIEISGNSDEANIKISVIDDSQIKNILINGKPVLFSTDSLSAGFYIKINTKEIDTLKIESEDIYKNKGLMVYTLIRTETTPPKVELISPYASDNGEIYLSSNDPNLYVEGNISDESNIKSIMINGVTASFKPDQLNPKFSANIDIANQNELAITATDIYGNSKKYFFKFNRSGADLLANNPMGKTWVVFIENSDYKSFTSLVGPKKDVTLMKSALSKYKIHNIIHKRNMTKKQMERFFAIELRDLVRSNHVNSILVWYAGHGKFISETGYWIPVDSKRDDEFSYYNINSLKASMQSYTKYITHTLIITDACESGPTFYMAMRSIPKERDCGDVNATKFKSSQVFTSAGYELATDKSQFTKTFASSLNYNSNSCIPIENIVRKVSSAVQKNSKQKPKFGKISGFVDENGTFFFIKK